MRFHALRLIFSAFLVAVAGFAPTISLHAQESTPESVNRMVSVYPADSELGDFVTIEVAAGESGQFTIVVANAGNASQVVRAYSVPAVTADNGGFAAAPYGTEPDTITGWLDIGDQTHELEAGVGQEIVVTVSVPDGTPAGEYVTSIAGEQAEAFEIPGTESMSQRVRQPMPVLIVVPGEFSASFDLLSASLEPRGTLLIGVVKIANTGTSILTPKGEAQLLDADGSVIGVGPIELGSVYVGTTGKIYLAWSNVPSAESYSLEIKLTDESTGASASSSFVDLVPVSEREITASATPAPELAFTQAELAPLTDDIPPSMLTFEGEISNPADPIEDARVSIVTYQDGVEVDRYPVLQGVTLDSGSTPLDARYSLPGGFTDGTYTFAVTIEIGTGGSQTVLVTQPIEFEITVGE